MKRVTLSNGSNTDINYEYRHNKVLLIFTNFSDIRLNQFADKLGTDCGEIECIENIIRYDDDSAAIVVTMKTGYNEVTSNKEIKKVFDIGFNNLIAV